MFLNKVGSNEGFTIIEITIVLTTISSLMILAFLGQRQLRASARFTDSVDRSVAALRNAQNEAYSTVNINPTNRGASPNEVFFGVLAQIDKDQTNIKFAPMYLQGRPEICGSSCTIELKETSSFEVPWGATFSLKDPVQQRQWVVFARNQINGGNLTYILPSTWGPDELTSYGSYATVFDPDTGINLTDGFGNEACITVDAASITKEIGASC